MDLRHGILSKPKRADVNALAVLMVAAAAKALRILIAAVDAQTANKVYSYENAYGFPMTP